MIKINERCGTCGKDYPHGTTHECSGMPDAGSAGSGAGFDLKKWKRDYQREYMRRRRAMARDELPEV